MRAPDVIMSASIDTAHPTKQPPFRPANLRRPRRHTEEPRNYSLLASPQDRLQGRRQERMMRFIEHVTNGEG